MMSDIRGKNIVMLKLKPDARVAVEFSTFYKHVPKDRNVFIEFGELGCSSCDESPVQEREH